MVKELLRYVLPMELIDFFDLFKLQEQEGVLHLHLDECTIVPDEYKELGLLPNGFYEASTLKDFPLRDKKVVLHIRRRRWKDAHGKSYSRQWDFAAEGTRYSKEFASFLKESFGYLPDSNSIS